MTHASQRTLPKEGLEPSLPCGNGMVNDTVKNPPGAIRMRVSVQERGSLRNGCNPTHPICVRIVA
jgi:hypothetical protein